MADRDDDAPEKTAAPLVSTRASPYPVSRLSPRFELVDLAAEIARADETLSMVASAKLDVIRRQIAALQEEARAVLEQTRFAAELHRARCTFHKVPGHVYHLYRRGEGGLYFSLLSPDDWGGAPPHAFEGSFRLEADQTFTRVGEVPPGCA
jgi:hypothetical protein